MGQTFPYFIVKKKLGLQIYFAVYELSLKYDSDSNYPATKSSLGSHALPIVCSSPFITKESGAPGWSMSLPGLLKALSMWGGRDLPVSGYHTIPIPPSLIGRGAHKALQCRTHLNQSRRDGRNARTQEEPRAPCDDDGDTMLSLL